RSANSRKNTSEMFGSVPSASVPSKSEMLKSAAAWAPKYDSDGQPLETHPSFRQVWTFYLDASSAGRRWDQLDAFINFVMAGLYVWNTTYLNQGGNPGIPLMPQIVDMVLAIVLLMQFLPRYYFTSDPVYFLIRPFSLSTIITVLTSVIVLHNRVNYPNIYAPTFMAAGYWVYLYPARFYRLQISLLRTLNPVKNVYHFKPVVRKALQAVATVFTAVLAITVLTHIVVYYQEPGEVVQDFGDAFFFTAVSSVTGLTSDIKPDRWYTRCITIFVMFLGLFWLPPRMSEMLGLWQNQLPWPKKFVPSPRQSHVIVIGCTDLPYYTIFEFLREFFCEDHGPQTLNTVVVFMSETEPGKETAELLRDPSYVNRVKYCMGSPTAFKHLERVHAHTAEAVFLLTQFNNVSASNSLSEMQKMDASQVMIALAIKKFLRSKSSRTKIIAQVILPETTMHLDFIAKSSLSIEKLRLGFLGQSVVVPGLTSMIQLLSTSIPSSTTTQLLAYCTEANGLKWFGEYVLGMAQEIYEVKMPSLLIGMTFQKAVQLIYQRHRATLFALLCYQDDSEMREGQRTPGTKLVVSPIGYKIRGGEIGFVMSTESKVARDISQMTAEVEAIDIDEGQYGNDCSADVPDESAPLLGQTGSGGDVGYSAMELSDGGPKDKTLLPNVTTTVATATIAVVATGGSASATATSVVAPSQSKLTSPAPLVANIMSSVEVVMPNADANNDQSLSKADGDSGDSGTTQKDKEDKDNSDSTDGPRDGDVSSVNDIGSELEVLYGEGEERPMRHGAVHDCQHSVCDQDCHRPLDEGFLVPQRESDKQHSEDEDDVKKISKSNLIYFSDDDHNGAKSPGSNNRFGNDTKVTSGTVEPLEASRGGDRKKNQRSAMQTTSTSRSPSQGRYGDNSDDKSADGDDKLTSDGIPVNLKDHIVICDTSDNLPQNLEYIVGCIRMAAPEADSDDSDDENDEEGGRARANQQMRGSPGKQRQEKGRGVATVSEDVTTSKHTYDGQKLTANFLAQLLGVVGSNNSAFQNTSREDAFKAKVDELQQKLDSKNEDDDGDQKGLARILPNDQAIVILSPGDFDIDQIELLQEFGNVYFVSGSPLSRTDLLRARIHTADGAIVLADGQSRAEASQNTVYRLDLTGSDASSTATADSPALLAALNIELLTSHDPDFFLSVEMIHRENMQYLGDTETLKVNEVYAQAFLRSSFMSGHTYCPLMSDTLVCQAYYNEHIVDLVHQLLFPFGDIGKFVEFAKLGKDVPKEEIVEILGHEYPTGAPTRRPSVASLAQSSSKQALKQQQTSIPPVSRVHLCRIPKRLIGRPYLSLFSLCCFKYNTVPIGLYRMSRHRGQNIWYCVPNPAPDSLLRKYDFVYILAPTAPKLK
ncbi:hypothetical protein EV182_001066, partial [Spiromyces aspiralis]